MPTTLEVRRDARQVTLELQALLQRAQAQGRADLSEQLEQMLRIAANADDRAARDPGGGQRDLERLRQEAARVEQALTGVRLNTPDDDEGMLEGTVEAR